MQHNDFEKNLRDKMEDFELTPNAAVWDRVGASMQKEKKRTRFLFFLWASLLLMVGGAAIFYFTGGSGKSIVGNETARTTPASNGTAAAPVPDVNTPTTDNVREKSSEKKDENTTEQKNSESVAGNHDAPRGAEANATVHKDVAVVKEGSKRIESIAGNGETIVSGKKVEGQVSNPTVKAKGNKTTGADKNNSTPIALNKSNNVSKADAKSPAVATNQINRSTDNNTVKAEETAAITKHETVTSTTTNKESNTEVKTTIPVANANNKAEVKATATTAAETKATAIKVPDVNPVHWGINFSAGISNNTQGFKKTEKPLETTRGGEPQPAFEVNHAQSFSYSLGAFVQRQMNKKFTLTAALNYHKYTSSSNVGDKISDAPVNYFDTSLNHSLTVREYYTTSNMLENPTKFTNKYHMVELPLTVDYAINGRSKNPIVLNLGVAPGFLIASDALYASDGGSKIQYVINEQYNKFQLSGQVGAMFPVVNKPGVKLAIGPYVQYGFSNLTRSSIGTNEHLIFTGIRTGITFK